MPRPGFERVTACPWFPTKGQYDSPDSVDKPAKIYRLHHRGAKWQETSPALKRFLRLLAECQQKPYKTKSKFTPV